MDAVSIMNHIIRSYYTTSTPIQSRAIFSGGISGRGKIAVGFRRAAADQMFCSKDN